MAKQRKTQKAVPFRAKLGLIGIPFFAWMFVWFSVLSFVPVPWPDDSAFYFVAHDFFQWPPKWIMSTQAPFEPSYWIWNFNTMPLYPILIGLGRFIGIDGSWGLKFWPLSAWAASAALLGWTCYRNKLPLTIAVLISLWASLDPALRWASVLVRPESLIGLAGLAIVLGLTFGWPEKLKPRGYWHPISFCLAVGAYSHFNAIHLIFPVLIGLANQPREIVRIGMVTTLYLVPWLATVLVHMGLFIHQMTVQWKRLAVGNNWLEEFSRWGKSLYPDMGVTDSWPETLYAAGWILWVVIAAALAILGVVLWKLAIELSERIKAKGSEARTRDHAAQSISGRRTGPDQRIPLAPAVGWVAGSIWIFHSKPEQWFIYYLHISIVTFAAVAATKLWTEAVPWAKHFRAAFLFVSASLIGLFACTTLIQYGHMEKQTTWSWKQYESLVDCIDEQLVALEKRSPNKDKFRVFGPTYPDILIELSRRHPKWGFTRTNDFWEAADRGVQHGHDVDAVVVTELYSHAERHLSIPASEQPQLQSVWMQWQPYYLHRLYTDPNWKQNRFICQRGRIQAFLYMR